MKRGFKLLLWMVCSALLLASSARHTYGQALEADITDQPIRLHLTDATLAYVISTLGVIHRVPIGWEVSQEDKNKPRLNIESTRGTRLRDILDQIVAQEPIYKWEVRDGVINFTPVAGREQFFEKLLSTQINLFAPPKNLTKFEIRDAIVDLPEVKELLTSENTTSSRFAYFYRPSIYSNPDVDLSISRTDVRGVLNKVIRDSEHKLWRIYWADEKKRLFEIGI